MRRLAELAVPLLLMVTWEGLVRFDLIPGQHVATPTGAAGRLVEMAAAGELWTAFRSSLERAAGGFLSGAIPGLLAGLGLGLVPRVRGTLQPTLRTWAPWLQAAIVPMTVLLLIPGELPPMKVIAGGVFGLLLVATLAGVVETDPRWLDVARSFGANRWHFCLTIALPGALPHAVAGLRLGAGMALLLTVTAELVTTPAGIGQVIRAGYEALDMDQVFVGLLLMALLGLLCAAALAALERKVVPWKP